MNASLVIEDILPLTPIQEFFRHGKKDSTLTSVLLYGYRITGALDPDTARDAWQAIVDNHPSLRTSLHVLEPRKAFQAVHGHAVLPWHYEDLRHLPATESKARIAAYQRRRADTPFDWHRPPLISVALHRLADREWVLTVTADHMIFDGWSLGLAISFFRSICSGAGEALREAAPSIAGYSLWQARQDHAAARDWFGQRLADIPNQRLPFAASGPWPEDVRAQKMVFLRLTGEEEGSLTAGAKRMGVTVYTLFQGAWSLILSRCQDERSSYYLSSVATRPSAVPGIDRTFGLLLSVIPICVACPPGARCASWLEALRTYQVECMDYTYAAPLETTAFQKKNSPVAQVSCLVFQNMDTGERESGGDGGQLGIAGESTISRSSYPLVVGGLPHQGLMLSLMYDERIFTRRNIEKTAVIFRQTMIALSENRDATLQEICNKPELAGLLKEASASMVPEFPTQEVV